MAKDRSLTVKFLGDPSGLQQSAARSESLLDKLRAKANELDGTFDDTATSGQKMGALLTAMAEQITSELDRAKAASSALAASLGEEQVAAIERAGGSIDATVEHLRRMGMTYEEIAAQADDVAVGVKALNDIELTPLNSEVKQVDGNLERVHKSGDQTRSVLANMVGNSVQDLGALGGVAGSAGVMIGQLGEYAADGNIKLGSLAALAVPMATLAGVTALVSDAMGDVAAARAFRREQVDGYTSALKGANTELAAVQSKLEDAGKIQIRIFDENYDITPALSMAGLNVTTFSQLVAAGKPKIDEWAAAMRSAGVDGDVLATVLRALDSESSAFADAQEAAAASAEFFGDKNKYAGMTSKEIADALKNQADVAEYYASRVAAATEHTEGLGSALRVAGRDLSFKGLLEAIALQAGLATDELKSMDDAYGVLTGHLDDRVAWRNLGDALAELKAKIDSGEKDWNKLADASDDAVRAAADYIETTDSIPSEVKTKLYQELDQGKLDQVLLELDNLRKGVDVPVRLLQPGDVGFMRNASGTDSSPGGLTLVGEEGPELVKMPKGARVYTASQTRAMLAGGGLSGNSADASGGTYTTSVTGGAAPAATSPASSGSSTSEATRMRNMYQRGAVGEDEYVAFLKKRQSALEPYSAEEQQVWQELQQIDQARTRALEEATAAAKKAADEQVAAEDRIMEARKDRGEISTEEWITYLEQRKSSMELYSVGEIALWARIQAARKDADAAAAAAATASDKATKGVFDAAAAAKEFADAAGAADQAMSGLSSAGDNVAAVGRDKKKTAADRARAASEFEQAKQNAADALYRRADAGANNSGFDDGTVEWARAVRAALTADRTNAPVLAEYIDRWLLAVPALARGGVIPATPGGMLFRGGEAGQREIVTPEDVMADVMTKVLEKVGAGRTVIQHVTVAERTIARDLADEAVWGLRVAG